PLRKGRGTDHAVEEGGRWGPYRHANRIGPAPPGARLARRECRHHPTRRPPLGTGDLRQVVYLTGKRKSGEGAPGPGDGIAVPLGGSDEGRGQALSGVRTATTSSVTFNPGAAAQRGLVFRPRTHQVEGK